LVKGKPWTTEEEERLRQLLKANRSARAIARIMGKSRECVSMKIARLGLEVVTEQKNSGVTTTSHLTTLKLPTELPSIEEQLRVLAAALEALRSPEIDKLDVLRLRAIIQGVRVYQDKVAEFVDYRGIEAKVVDLEAKYAKLLEDKTKDNSSKPVPSEVVPSPAQ
jgi:IS30 family transposase